MIFKIGAGHTYAMQLAANNFSHLGSL
jgi:hypothetical protein